jgi:2-oxoisovalerate dehydrogenase E2 component (dihydrolipoyl transacylase)
MKIFKLPDLGEGLPEAEIREWHVQIGDTVTTDQLLVSVETAKALVDVPAPYNGTIEKLFGDVGDTIETDKPLIGFIGEAEVESETDAGTVVGKIEVADSEKVSATEIITSTNIDTKVKATPAVRALAKKLKVNIHEINSSNDRITKDDVRRAAINVKPELLPHYQKLSASQHAMALTMQHANSEIVPITVTDDININTWFKQDDLTLRVIAAIHAAVIDEPIVNSHFDSTNFSFRTFNEINLGIAVDSEHGLYVPVVRDIGNKTPETWRDEIEQYKNQAATKSIKQDNLKDATIVLSNFGSFAAKYATPVVTPPTVCIIGTGKVYQAPVVEADTVKPAYVLPVSITADHRLITGGQLTRFLASFKNILGS